MYGIVNQSNGHIWVYSELGHGTTFKVYFPGTREAASATRVVAKPEPALCGKETLLLVEDEVRLRDLLAHVLRDRGYKVLVAGNGSEALRVARKQDRPIDLLITDVVMPGMRGQALADKMVSQNPNLAVIYMSGYTDNSLIHSGSLEQGVAFLQKPFTPDKVLQQVRQVLDNQEQRRTRRRAV